MGIRSENATVTEGTGDFQDCPDDTYMAMVRDVSEPFVSVDPTTGNERTQITIEWELMPRPDQVENGAPESGYTRKQWVTLTDNFLDHGYVDKKSKLFTVLEALGYDMTGTLAFDSDEWQGRKAKVTIKHNAKGYPNITDLLRATPAKAAAAPTKRAPVGVGASVPRGRAVTGNEEGWGDEDKAFE